MNGTTEITLARRWRLGEAFAEGGFGRVFHARDESGQPAVVKLIPKEPGADRELLIENLESVRNVVPVLDRGEWQSYWVVVMPLADRSLQDRIEEVSAPFAPDEVVTILADVGQAIADFSPRVVHRDVTPRNILLYNGHWCLSDFGIARYAEASTATDTLKHALSPPYAAPERWTGDRATSAVDIYSVGAIAYQLLTGRLPFAGPSLEDFREQHLNQPAPPMTGVPPLLASLALECLLKPAGARPSPANLLARLTTLPEQVSPGQAMLQALNQRALEQRATEAADQARRRSVAEQRRALANAGCDLLSGISTALRDRVQQAAPEAREDPSHPGSNWQLHPARGWAVRLLSGRLVFTECDFPTVSQWGDRPPAFDVVAVASVGVEFDALPNEWRGRSHSLWYCDAIDAGVFRWYETAFMYGPLSGLAGIIQPFDRDPSPEVAKALHGDIGGSIALDWSFLPIDQGQEESFIERWLTWFAQASDEQLARPIGWPEHQARDSFRHQ